MLINHHRLTRKSRALTDDNIQSDTRMDDVMIALELVVENSSILTSLNMSLLLAAQIGKVIAGSCIHDEISQ